MPPEFVLAPYSLTTIVVASLTLSVMHLRLREATSRLFVPWLISVLLVFCSIHLCLASFAAIATNGDGLEADDFHMLSHGILNLLFATISIWGLPMVLFDSIPLEEGG